MPNRLTRSQLQCVRLAGEGLTDKAIARQLKISHRTVQTHLREAYERLGVNDRRTAYEAVRRKYGELPIPISEAEASGSGDGAAAVSQADPERGESPVSQLAYAAFLSVRRLGRPRRLGGSLLPMIMVWSLLGLLLLIVVVALSNALIGSANVLAEHAYRPAS